MGLYKRGEIYWFTITHEGQRIQESLGTDNKKMAEKAYAKTLTDIVEGRYFEATRAKRSLFQEMTTKYLKDHEHSRDQTSLKQLSPFFNGRTLFQITTRLVAEYREKRTAEKAKPATIYQELALLRRMFNVAIKEWQWLKINPVSSLSFSVGNRNARTRWLTPEEQETLLSCATNPAWLRPLLVTALYTGMRRGEMLALTWRDIDSKQRIIRIEQSKNGDRRSVPISETLQGTLDAIKVRDISGKVFPIAVRSVRAAFDKALERAKIEDFHFHDLRHTFATRLVQNGVDLYKVKELLGHKTIAMTMRYAHHYPESLRSSVEVLDRCYNSATVEAKGN
jgi:integrase